MQVKRAYFHNLQQYLVEETLVVVDYLKPIHLNHLLGIQEGYLDNNQQNLELHQHKVTCLVEHKALILYLEDKTKLEEAYLIKLVKIKPIFSEIKIKLLAEEDFSNSNNKRLHHYSIVVKEIFLDNKQLQGQGQDSSTKALLLKEHRLHNSSKMVWLQKTSCRCMAPQTHLDLNLASCKKK